MSKKIYSILVMGTVERRVIVSGESLAEAEANAYSEWSNLTGGHIGTAESVEAYEVVLDYLLSEGHADTVEEAHYVMMQLDSEFIQNIIEN